MYTQCPQCLTYFQVTPEHLKVAQGNVRCGQCQNVFSALGNLTDLPPEATSQQPVPEAKKSPKPPRRNFSNKFDDFAQDLKPKKDSSAKKPKKTTNVAATRAIAKKPVQKGLSAAIEAMNKLNKASTGLPSLDDGRRTFIGQLNPSPKSRPRNIAPKVNIPQIIPKDFAQEIEEIVLEAPSEIQTPKPKQLKKAVPAVIKKKSATKKKKKKALTKPTPMRPPGKPGKEIAIGGTNNDIDLQKALMAIDELDLTGGDNPKKNNPLSDDFFNPRATNNNLVLSNFDSGFTPPVSDRKIKPLGRPNSALNSGQNTTNSGHNPAHNPGFNPGLNPSRAMATRPPPPSRVSAIAAPVKNMMQLIPKPLLADFQQAQSAQGPNSKQHRSINFWVIGSMILMVVFLGQTIYFNHDDLAKNQTIRPWIETFCAQADCEVSLPYERKYFELLGQDIRSHPKIKKALLVSVTIINNARYIQAFPGLQITFTDMNDQKVAMRRFKPHEFLSARTNIENGMLSNTPFQVEIKILDPGSKAVNFEFSFFNAG